MALDENIPERNRSEYVVWDYPLEDKFTKMYHAMEEVGFVRDAEEAAKMVRKVNRTHGFAFIAEAMTIRYLMLTSCDLGRVGEEFGKKSFAFAVQKDSPLKEMLDHAITRLTIRRRLNELEKKWWEENPLRESCPADTDVNAGFGFDNLAVTFVMILVGILLAVLILCLQCYWYRYQLRRRTRTVRLFVRTLLTRPDEKDGN